MATIVSGYLAKDLKIEAGFESTLPIGHEYVDTFLQYRKDFSGANRVLIAFEKRDGTIWDADFLQKIRSATDDLFYVTGVARGTVTSLWTANTRYIELVEDGLRAGDVIPSGVQLTPESIEMIQRNVLKGNHVGRLVSFDFKSTLLTAELQEIHPRTRLALDPLEVARQLEKDLRDKYETDDIKVRIVGFAPLLGQIASAAGNVVEFFGFAFLLTVGMVYLYCRSWRLTLVTLFASLCSLIWQFGLLAVMGLGVHPLSILVPFLVFAIGVSHGVQQLNMIGAELAAGRTKEEAARTTFSFLFVPGLVALLSTFAGFATLGVIPIGMIRELAVAASVGIALKIVSNLVMLPLLASYIAPGGNYPEKVRRAMEWRARFWPTVATVAGPRFSFVVVGLALVLGAVGLYEGRNLQIGDVHAGAAELRPNARYNQDIAFITSNYAIGLNVLTAIVEAPENACVDYTLMRLLDHFQWTMANVPGVQAAVGLPFMSKTVGTIWREGNLRWRAVPRDRSVLSQAVGVVPTASGLLNSRCTVLPLMVFTSDTKAETLHDAVVAVDAFRRENKLGTTLMGLLDGMPDTSAADRAVLDRGVHQSLVLLGVLEFLENNRETFQRFGIASNWLDPALREAMLKAPASQAPIDTALATMADLEAKAGAEPISNRDWREAERQARTPIDELAPESRATLEGIQNASEDAKRARVAQLMSAYLEKNRPAIETGNRNFLRVHPLDWAIQYFKSLENPPAVLTRAAEFLNLPETRTRAVNVRLASGNGGILAATNQAVAAAEIPMLLYVYAVVMVLVIASYREWRGALVCVLPLILSTIIGNWLLTLLGIGLKVSTLPVLAIAVGIGVDYGIYEYNRIQRYMSMGKSPYEAYLQALHDVGSATMFTGFTLAIGVALWSFSELKFQADMGLLLTIMFMVNMIGAVTLLPALVAVLEVLVPRRGGVVVPKGAWH
ncbi:efflux RND transporter permease subunit [Zavarzinia sp. CC-PAN008]|uniref:efflux RND transporter permease subunit n=1 Tax=Zavarzinia sp. CC-PAN008 TaxID=3243332 RepID=UPI003F7487FE